MKDSSRAIRRHHRDRLKNTRKNYWNGIDKEDKVRLGKVVNAPNRCKPGCMCKCEKNLGKDTLKDSSHKELFDLEIKDLNA